MPQKTQQFSIFDGMIIRIILVLAVAFGPASTQTSKGCDTKADVTFLLDSSDNVGQYNFDKQLNFVKDVTDKLQIAPDKTQVSAVTFSTGVDNQFNLNQYTNKMDLDKAILNIPFKGGLTHTSEGIRYVTSNSFGPANGGRFDAPHVMVVLTNGPSGKIDMTKLAAQTARDNGIILYSVGIGAGVDMNELQAIATDPDSRHLFNAQNFDALSSLSDLLATKICNELPPDPTQLPTPTGCLNKADLVFMVDSSSSVGSTNFQKLEHFLKDVTTKLDVSRNGVHVGLVKYGSYPSAEFPLTTYQTRPEVMKAVEAMTFMGGGTNDADALTYMSNQMFSQNNGARGDVPRIAVMITDGGSANTAAAIAAADKARQNNIGILAVGVGNRVNKAQLERIGDKPYSDNTFMVNSYDNLDSISDQLISQMCKVQSTVPSLTTSAPGGTLPPDPCQDKLSNCDAYDSSVCNGYPDWAKQNCARFCGTCTPLYTTAPPACTDKLHNCPSYGKDTCSRLGSWAKTNCRLFCGLCGNNTSSTGYYGQCYYKGQSYSQGQKWYDGCDYECLCEDGNTGRYKCNNRCPVYYNLPTDCTLIAKPGECCLQPVCNFNPTVNSVVSSGHGQTTNGIDVCQYKTKQYFQGQSWRDGCDYQCRCTDASKGVYKCEDLCPVYRSIPPYCHLERKAGECCEQPVCEFDQQSGSFQGYGSISGNGVGTSPSQQLPCMDAIAQCSSYGKSVCTSFRGWAERNCKKYCDLCPTESVGPSPEDRCIYNGQFYYQGQHWNTSCDTTCTCENAKFGYYRCVNSCPTYNNLPNSCKMVQKAGDCCPTIQCDNGYFISSTTNLGNIGNGGMLNVSNPPSGMTQVVPTLPSGEVPRPGTGGTGFQPPVLNGCLYKGQLYVQDQAWEDGCDFACYCKDAYTGLYSCKQKCPAYPTLPGSCRLQPDPNDVCCMTPTCTKDPVTQKIPVPIPVFPPSYHSHSVVEPPQITGSNEVYTMTVYLVQTGMTPVPPTPMSGVGTGGIGYCAYNNKQYKQGDIWEDGCEFNCVCEDATKGFYRCVDKCVKYDILPAGCYLEKDPVNPCCDIPKCVFPVNYVTHIGELMTTPKPVGETCVYEGQTYQQGQTWYDDCRYKCTCEDALNNIYRCLSRCPEYENVDENCEFVPDPQDPACCSMPQCYVTGTVANFTNTNPVPTPAPSGTYSGQGTGVGYCEYKGIHYAQGQTWQDGCNFNCECTDEATGLYRCSEACERYINLPEYCTLITDFKNPCCKVPRCNFPATTAMVTGIGTGSPVPHSTLAPTPRPPGQTLAPGLTEAPQYKSCVYKGVQYLQGQTWEDGCYYKCRCDEADKGLYTCNQRCPQYESNLPTGCRMVTDPRDSCCLVPQCDVIAPTPKPQPPGVSTQAPAPYKIPTAAPGQIIGSVNVPTPGPNPDGSYPTPSPLNYCEYKGMQYTQGQKWDDGCEFTCECLDAHIGQYKCLEKCARYVNLPTQCRLSRDPANPCCQIPECNGSPTPSPPGQTQAPTLGPGMTPTPGPTNMCVYKGKMYSQGQTWYDECNYICNCEDALAGLYRCNNRCPQYDSIPAQCHMEPSSTDPLCCKEPKCNFVPTYNTTGFQPVPTPPPGVIDGGVATPTPKPHPYVPTVSPPVPGVSTQNPPTFGPTPSPRPSVCVYKGSQYQQGQKWQDECNYNCECLDALAGHYRCTEMCPKYDNLPTGCRLVRDIYNPCCQKAYCDASKMPTPQPTAKPTPAPGPGVSTFAPSPEPKSGCMYNGVLFKQDQQWYDGCDLKCICEDQMTGFYRCSDRCPSYDVPAYCTLVTDPRDSCCKVPKCDNVAPTPKPTPQWVPGMVPTPAPGVTYAPDKVPTPAPGQTYAPGLYPTWVPGMVPTPAPGFTYAPDRIPTPAPGRTYAPGQYPTYVPGMVPTPAPGFTYAPDKIPTPAPGKTYAPGQYPTWVPGMVPTPAPGVTYATNKIPTPAPGKTYAPGQYPTYVPGMVPTPAPGYTYAPDKIPTPAPGRTYAPGQYPTWVPGMVPTPAPGFTYAPDKVPTPAPGKTYAPGQYPTWVPGMVPTPAPGYTYPPYMIPTPAPGKTYAPGQFPVPTTTPYPTPRPGETFPPWKPGMVPTPYPGQTYAPDLIPTPSPGATYAPNSFPTWVPGMIPTVRPGVTLPPWLVPTPAPGSTYAPFKYPTWVPGMIPTPAPNVTYAPDKIPTPAPGKTYAPGNFPTYVPGMVPTPAPGFTYAPDKIPTPAPGKTYPPGQFPTYVPGMVPTPAPGFTYAPDKIPTPAPGKTYAPGQYPTWVPGMVPTPAPGVTYPPYKIPTPAPGKTYAPGQYPTYVPGMVPTPAPGMTYAPDKIPTPAPGKTYAPGQYPTYVPGMVPTPAPGMTYAPDKIPTPAPGKTYAPGQYPTWVPGMVPTPAPGVTYPPFKIPTPAPGKTYAPGQYPTYVPGMVPTPAPGMTYAPDKIPTPAPGKTYAPGQYPTWVPGMVPTPAPGFTYAPDKIPTPAPGKTYAPGQYPTWVPGMVPTPAPGYTYPPYMIPTPAPGKTYAPGQFPVLTTTPYPTPRPGETFPPWKPGMVPTPYPGQTYAPDLIPTPSPGATYAPNSFPTWVPGMIPTVRPGVTLPPWLVPTPAPGSTYAPFKYPTWVPGMIPTPAPGVTYAPDKIPTPAPGKTYAPGNYPTYVPGMVPTPAPGFTYSPDKIPTPAPGKTYAPGQFPTWVPGMVPTPAPGFTYAPDKIPTPAPGKTYAPGQYPTYVPGMVPTPAPGMTYAPDKIPTPAPGWTYAPGKYPTYVPGMVPTPAPGMTYAPDKIPTPAPGQTYAPGQYPTWVPGMVPTPAPGVTYSPFKIPTPAPGQTYAPGQYPTYVPGMVPTPAPGMTYAPDKIPTPAPGRTYAPGQYPTWVPGMVPTPAPGMTYAPDKIPTPAPGKTYAPGQYPTWIPGMVPTPAPGVTYSPFKIPTPAPGQTYAPGQYPTYVPGMVPTPAPGMTYAPDKIPTPAPGKTYAPGYYPTWVPGMVPTPAPGFTYAPDKVPTPAPGKTYAPGQYPTWVPGMVPTPAPGYTYPPYMIPTPAPGKTYAPGQFPVPTTTPYPTPRPGETFPPWKPGMVPTPYPGQTYAPDLIPTPSPGATYAPNSFPTWVPGMIPTVRPGVTLPPWLVPTPAPGSTYAPFKYPTWVPGMIPTPAPNVTYAPDKIPTPAPGKTYAPGNYPTYVPGMVPTPAPGFTYAPDKIPTPAPGKTYAPGQFPTYVPGMVPTPAPGFTYAPDKIPTPAPGKTYPPGQYPTWVPGMVPTPAPGVTYSPYKIPTPAPGQTYAPGMYPTWVPGMVPTPAPGVTYAPDKIPTPSPGRTYAPGMYPTWVPGMVPTPAPGQTYAPDKIPTPAPGQTYAPGMFPTPTPSPTPFKVPTAIPGIIQGTGVNTNSNNSACMYHGIAYKQGQKWQDGCKYDCECIDEHTGRYRCKERCSLYLNLPSYCRLVVDPNDACCKIPVCNPPVPTPAPSSVPTPQPSVNPSPGVPTNQPNPNPSAVPTPMPKAQGCMYMGKQYVQGQSWYDGCEKKCTCENGTTGFYRCFDRCAKYTSVPPSCTLVADPNDPACCKVPQCIPLPTPGNTIPTNKPFTVTGITGVITGGGDRTTPVYQPGVSTSAPNNVCIYGGRMYHQGQKWQDGCKYECICTDAMTGKYQCSERCPKYPFVPPQCSMQRDPNDICCFVPVCDYNQTVPTPAPFGNPTPAPSPGVSTMVPPTTPPNQFTSFCVYKGVPYMKGQTWDDGCTKKCRCDDADMNVYTCFDRCASYNNLSPNCVMVADPKDSCCQIPKCTYIPSPAPNPTPGPGVSTQVPPQVNSPTPGPNPSPIPTAPTGVISGGPQPNPITGLQPTNVGYCVYKGKQYTNGQKWDDGCAYTCTCVDEMSGQYSCDEKCPRYVQIPSYCTMVQDPNERCCKKPYCPGLTPTKAPTPQPGVSTMVPTPAPSGQPTIAPPQPPKDVCIMNGKTYTQGQKWYDGCQKICICNDGKTGAYSCTDRCATFQLQPNCVLIPDQRDPLCCQMPKCDNPNPSNITGTGVVGTITGVGTPPTPTAGPTPSPGSPTQAPTAAPPKVCVYKTNTYTQGQKWQDGCQYDCECVDAMNGKYVCTDRCRSYPNLPASCHMAYDPLNPCCQKPVCNSPTQAPPPGVSTISPTPNPFPTPSPTEFCVYQGVKLLQGQSFNQGCDKICKCEDAKTGRITCRERCPTYPALKAGCTLVTDPKDQCCQIQSCVNPQNPNLIATGGTGTFTGSNMQGTNPYPGPGGTRNACVYNGKIYNQGQTWDDGCTYTCECIDSSTGLYQCTEKCPRYPTLPSYCTMVQDPANTCCQKPYCTPISNQTPQPPTGPTPSGLHTPTPGPSPTNVCVYKNNVYQQGQQWFDGCQYNCRCDNAATGFYQCSDRCQPTTNMKAGCTLKPDPKDPTCCQVADCPGSPTPGPSTAPQPKGYCVYKGVYYTQGQTWFDGCNKKCRCEDVMNGYYTCDQRCPSYTSLPATCTLKTDPNDACCVVPDCNRIPTPQTTVAPVPGRSTPVPYIVPTAISGTFTGSSGGNPINVPYQPGSQFTGSSNACVYKGKIYTQGQTWPDGCDYNCECIDASRGQYRCTDRCPKYYYLPPQCHFEQSPTDTCCKLARCSTTLQPTTHSPVVVVPGSSPGPSGTGTPSPIVTVTPPDVTGSNIPITVPVPDKCVYFDGKNYPKGATWQDGCKQNCQCDDPAMNRFTCTNRCPAYSGLPAFCTLVSDPSDTCCKKPQCTLPSGVTLQPIIGGGFTGSATPPTSLQVLPVGTHTVFTGSGRPVTGTVLPGGTFAGRDRCIYKGSIYSLGQSWDDGCNYVCTCENATTGMYRCVSKCPRYPTLPSYCKTVNVPGQCCQSITCDIPGYGTYNPVPQLVPTPRPTTGPSGVQPSTPDPQIIIVPGGSGSTVIGTGYPGGGYYLPNATKPDVIGQLRDKCVYNNRLYNQGETWDDGCNYHCECLDGRTGFYECKPLCPVYNNLPSNQCYSVRADGQCCSVPMCYDPSVGNFVNTLTSPKVFPVVGTYQGGFTGFRPGYIIPGTTYTNGSRNACVYKGVVYRQGDTWDDGCDFSCDCRDESQGLYICRTKCPTYTQIPPVCQLQSQPNSCCKQLTCTSKDVTTPSSMLTPTPQAATTPLPQGNCTDAISNCKQYGQQACNDPYKEWAKRNCPLYCNICHNDFTTPSPVCADKLSNCHEYGKSACTGIYEPWAKDNCRKYCNHCSAVTTPAPATTKADCVDEYPDCASLGTFYCTDSYKDWSMKNCKKYCSWCHGYPGDVSTTPSAPKSTTINPYSWLLMMKGVAGAPGPDLNQLWHSSQTLNPTEPLASHLTSEFNGHYKPDYSNHWSQYCIDKVKVSIYNNGIEKANIIFDATGADKNSWFDQSRIIDSTWSDIKTAPKEIFSMAGDPVTGREFYASAHSTGCDAFGWIMVSTKDTCFYEAADKKPTFYYAPGTTQAHWGFTNPETGDVFAIQAHPTCFPGQPTASLTTASTAQCVYNGVSYNQGAYWTSGCDYNCTCVDASLGYYRCSSLCPDYTNLPPGCSLVKQPGECCGVPDCLVTVATKKPTTIIVIPTKTCYYNGNFYRQDETWNDGCRQTCTCTDAATGSYRCRAKCLNFAGILPSQCNLGDPPPGLCCKQPSCPSGIVVQIPQAFKDDYPGPGYVYV